VDVASPVAGTAWLAVRRRWYEHRNSGAIVTLVSSDRFVPFDITVCGIDELPAMCDRDVSHVLTLLDPGWPTPEALDLLGARRRLDMRFYDVIDPTVEFPGPEAEHAERLLAFGRDLDQDAGHLLVHCHMGISRSSASMFLILAQARPDRAAPEVLAEVVRIRPHAWPNLRLVELGDAALGRGGTLVAAAVERYRDMLERRPKLREAMAKLGRSRELAAADSTS
jgi:predicted protein tyrosine phosphatase